MAQNRFTDPFTGNQYLWAKNHSEEEESGKARSIERTANTGNVGAVRQQGDAGSYTLRLKGTALLRSQIQAFWSYYALSDFQTIYFRDFDNQEYEVQITNLLTQRHRTIRNPREPTAKHYWTYTIEMEVYAFRSGDLAGIVTP